MSAAMIKADAAEWAVEPAANLSAYFSNNPRLQNLGQQDAYGGLFDASLALARRTEISQSWLRTALASRRFTNQPLLDTDDQSLALGWSRLVEHGQWGANVNAIRDHTLSSELETTGLTEVNKRRTSLEGTLSGEWRTTERLAVGSRLTFQRVDYEQDPLRLLVDYDYPSAIVYAQYTSSERTIWSVNAAGSSLQGPQVIFGARNYTLRTGVQHDFDEHWQAGFSIGPSRLEPRYGESSYGLAYSANVSHPGERNIWTLDVARQRSPNGYGVLSDQTSLDTHLTHYISEIWTLDSGLRLVRSDDQYGRGFNLHARRDYGRADVRLNRRLSADWNLALAWAYSRQRYAGPSPDASGHEVTLGVRWAGWRETMSR
jgi:hypothetical protein